MSYPADIYKKFTIVPTKETVTKEEIPRLLGAIGSILVAAAKAYENFVTKDWQGLATNITTIVREAAEIKEILET